MLKNPKHILLKKLMLKNPKHIICYILLHNMLHNMLHIVLKKFRVKNNPPYFPIYENMSAIPIATNPDTNFGVSK